MDDLFDGHAGTTLSPTRNIQRKLRFSCRIRPPLLCVQAFKLDEQIILARLGPTRIWSKESYGGRCIGMEERKELIASIVFGEEIQFYYVLSSSRPL